MDQHMAPPSLDSGKREVPGVLRQEIRAQYEKLLALRGGKKRRGQQMIIGGVATAVANGKRLNEKSGRPERLLAVQAPTGTGKSIGYCLGSIPVAKAMGLKVVISTGTVALQEQLVNEDMPRLAQVVNDLEFILIKGRGRYGCPVRMQGLADEGNETAQFLMSALEGGEWTGDVDALAEPIEQTEWQKMTNDRNGCGGRKCSKFDACPYYRVREAGKRADVVVTNHDLLLSDLKGGNTVLPKPEEAVYIIDEAHELPEKALKMMGESHALRESEQWATSVEHMMARVRRAGGAKVFAAKVIAVLDGANLLRACASEARMAIESMASTEIRDPAKPLRFAHGRLPAWLQCIVTRSEAAAGAVFEALEELRTAVDSELGDGLQERERELILSELGRAVGMVRRIRVVWHLMGAEVVASAPPAKWVEVIGTHDDRDLRLCASPVGVGEMLHESMWSRCAAAIHLSATLYTVGGFGPYLDESGLGLSGAVGRLEVESPFNYTEQGRLIVPKGISTPKDAEQHTKDLCRMLPEWLNSRPAGEGALVLFASWGQMKQVSEQMPPEIRARILMQGERSKREIISAHKKAIDAGVSSIIFGTSSFETGIDLPGKLLTLVVIAKLQFSVPTNPVEMARAEWLESIGKSYFAEVALPNACKRLAQSGGRLLRTESDRGEIIVADARLTQTRYGRSMLAALPAYRLDTRM